MSKFQYLFNEIKNQYKQSWFGFLFSFTSISQLLSQNKIPGAGVFFEAYLNSWWWNRLWFRSIISSDYEYDFDKVIKALTFLKKYRIFNTNTCHLVANDNEPFDMALVLLGLKQLDLLTMQNEKTIVTHINPFALTRALSILQKAKILNQNNLNTLANHSNFLYVVKSLHFLWNHSSVNQEHFDIVTNHTDPLHVVKTLFYLQQANILTKDNLALITHHDNLPDLTNALDRLQQAKMLHQDIFTIVATHADPLNLANALLLLLKTGILTLENNEVLVNHPHLPALTEALFSLWELKIFQDEILVCNGFDFDNAYYNVQNLNQKNFDIVAHHGNPLLLSKLLDVLGRAGILLPEYLDLLAAPNHAILVTDEAFDKIWHEIPIHCLTQAHFEELLAATKHDDPMNALEHIRDQIIHTDNRTAGYNNLNLL